MTFPLSKRFSKRRFGRRSYEDGSLTLRVADVREHTTARASLYAKRSVENRLEVGLYRRRSSVGASSSFRCYTSRRKVLSSFRPCEPRRDNRDRCPRLGLASSLRQRFDTILGIVNDIEDIAREIGDNEQKSQIMGLVIALRRGRRIASICSRSSWGGWETKRWRCETVFRRRSELSDRPFGMFWL